MLVKGRPIKLPNKAARSLALGQFAQKKVKSGKLYTRKIKHRNRDRDPGSFVCKGLFRRIAA